MLYLLIWWALLVLLGFAALPITMRFLRFLPDRGYAFAKPLALLLWIYPFWLLAVLGFIQNSFGALAIMVVAIAIVAWGLVRGKGQDSVLAWLRADEVAGLGREDKREMARRVQRLLKELLL